MLLTTSCSTVLGSENERKNFIPGGYYKGEEADKVFYGPDDEKPAVDPYTPEDHPNAGVKPNEIAEVTIPPMKASSDKNLGWFFTEFDNTAGQLDSKDGWNKSDFVFEVGSAEILSPMHSKITSFSPKGEDVKNNSNRTNMYYSASIPNGYTMQLTSNKGHYKSSGKEVLIRVTYYHIERFFCCFNKTVPDYELQRGSDINFTYAPVDRILDNQSIQAYAKVALPGKTGDISGRENSKNYCGVKLEYMLVEDQTQVTKKGKWKPLSFEEFWKVMPKEVQTAVGTEIIPPLWEDEQENVIEPD